jgi:ATP-dependent DNA ligase
MKLSQFTYFYPEAPALANIDQPLFARLSDDPQWIAEPKYNGQRLELHCLPGEEPQFWGRHKNRLTYSPSREVLAAIEDLHLPGYCILDGELRHAKVPGVSHKIMFYDVHVWDWEILLGKPFWFRRGLIEDHIFGFPFDFPLQYRTEFLKHFSLVVQDPELEGLVMKRFDGKLALGRKAAVTSTWMIKVRRESGRYRF